jgi:hypothetical protein
MEDYEIIILMLLCLGSIAVLFYYLKRKQEFGKIWKHKFCSSVKIGEKKLSCHHCGGSEFYKKEGKIKRCFIQIKKMILPFKYPQLAACYHCVRCGFLH